ncbi:MAG: glycosyltransferase family 4 protein [Acidobacteriaceae bacterium]|nr:glycosyltransferase family 4 protein [Acidobacteriaceae bacterium]
MKACMVSYSFYESDNRVRRYAEALAQRGDEVHAITLRRPGQPHSAIIKGVHVHRIQKRARDERGPLSYLRKILAFFFRSAWLLAWQHLKAPYQFVHVHSVPDFEIFAAALLRFLGAKVILDIHDIVPELYASKFRVSESSAAFRLLLLLEKLSTGFADHVIIANHLWYGKLVARAVAASKCTPIINYPDPSLFYPIACEKPQRNDFLLCYPGTLNSHQGLDVAVRAVALLRQRIPTLRFLIVGDGPERENLACLIKSLRLEDHVTLADFVPIEQIAAYMTKVDLGVVPKRSDSFGDEAFSTKIMEFMATGVPVIASSTRIDRYYFNPDIVQFFESGNPNDLAEKIFSLWSNPSRLRALAASARAFIEQNNWRVKRAEYLELVDRLLSKPAHARSLPSATPASEPK